MANNLVTLRTFKENMINFFDELIGQFPNEGDFVVMRIFLKDQVPIVDIMHFCCHRLLPLKHKIKERDDAVFLDNDALFEKVSKEKVIHFKRLWRSNHLAREDREVIWSWLDLFIKLMEKYQKSLVV